MNFDEYDIKAKSTDLTDGKGTGLLSISFMDKLLGLVGESAEIADKVKKLLRDKDATLDEADRKELVKELGDVLWYVSRLADGLGSSLGEVAEVNVHKLADRQKRTKLGGSGDNR